VGATREKRLAGIGDECSLCSGCLRWQWNRHSSSTIVADGHLRSAACGNGRCSLWRQRVRIRADCFWWRAAVQLELGRRVWFISSSRARAQRLGHLRAAHHKRHLQRRYNRYRLAIAAAACKRQLCDNDCAYGSAKHYLGESFERSCWAVLWASGVRKCPPFQLHLRIHSGRKRRHTALPLELGWSSRVHDPAWVKYSDKRNLP